MSVLTTKHRAVQILTESTAGPALEDEAVGHGSVPAQSRQLPVADHGVGGASAEDQQVVAQVEGGRSALQLCSRSHANTEPVHWTAQRRGFQYQLPPSFQLVRTEQKKQEKFCPHCCNKLRDKKCETRFQIQSDKSLDLWFIFLSRRTQSEFYKWVSESSCSPQLEPTPYSLIKCC